MQQFSSEKANPIKKDDPQPEELWFSPIFLNNEGEEARTISLMKTKSEEDKG